MDHMKTANKNLITITAAFVWLFSAYVLSYLIWINYISSGNYIQGIFGVHGIHVGMDFAAAPSPRFLQTIYMPLMKLDVLSGRLIVGPWDRQ